MTEFPLNIPDKEDYPDKLIALSGTNPKYYESAEEKNKKTRALTELDLRDKERANELSDIKQSGAGNSFSNEIEMTDWWTSEDAAGRTPIDTKTFTRTDLTEEWAWDSSVASKGMFSKKLISLEERFSTENSIAEKIEDLSIADFTLDANGDWDYTVFSKPNFNKHYQISGTVDFTANVESLPKFMINLNGIWSNTGSLPDASGQECNIEITRTYYKNTFEIILNDNTDTAGGKEQGKVNISSKVKNILDFKIEVHSQNVFVYIDNVKVLSGVLTEDLTNDFILYMYHSTRMVDITNLKVSTTNNLLQKSVIYPQDFALEFKELDVDLTSLEEIEKVGGVVTLGTQGTNNSVVKIPIIADENCTIDFDFELGQDVHSGFGRERILEMALNTDDFNEVSGGNLAALKLLLDINSVLPVTGDFVPNYRSRFEYGFAHGNYNWTDYTNKYQYNSELFNNSLNREDAFSIRKVTPVAADVNITLTIDSTKLSIKDNGVVVSEYTLANYTLVDDLLDAIEADSNLSDYEVLRFQSAIPTSDLTKMTDVKLVVLRNAVDYNDGETVTGTIYDGFEVFAPINSVGKKHNCKILIDYDNDDYKILIDGVELGLTDSNFPANLKRLNGWLTLGGSSLYSDTTGTFTGKITSFKLRKGLIKPKKFVVMTGHIVQDAKDYPSGSGDYGHLITSTGRLNRIFDYANQNGYKPVSIYDIVNYKKGWVDESQIPDKCYTIIFDDYPFWIHQTERFRNVFKRYGVKANMALQMDFIQSSENLKTIKQMKSLGWEIFPHSYKHAYIDRYSYPQLIQTLTEIRTVFDTLEIDTNVFVYPYGSIDKKTAKVLKSRGFQLGFKVGSSDINYGEDDFQMNRLDTSEIGTSWSGITNVLDR